MDEGVKPLRKEIVKKNVEEELKCEGGKNEEKEEAKERRWIKKG